MDAYVYAGVLLSEKRAMNIFGAKYINKIYDKCPADKITNPNKHPFCSRCGTKLEYKAKIRDGADELSNIQDFMEFMHNGLEAIITEDANENKFVLIGKEIAKTYTSEDDEHAGIEPFKINEKTMKNVAQKMEKLGVKGQIKTYVVAL